MEEIDNQDGQRPGFWLTYIDRDPKVMERQVRTVVPCLSALLAGLSSLCPQKMLEKRESLTLDDQERQALMIEKQIERAKEVEGDAPKEVCFLRAVRCRVVPA